MGITKLFSKPKQPNLAAAQEKAAIAERNKIATENAAKENQALKKSNEAQSKRMAFSEALTPAEDDTAQRRRFLKGA